MCETRCSRESARLNYTCLLQFPFWKSVVGPQGETIDNPRAAEVDEFLRAILRAKPAVDQARRSFSSLLQEVPLEELWLGSRGWSSLWTRTIPFCWSILQEAPLHQLRSLRLVRLSTGQEVICKILTRCPCLTEIIFHGKYIKSHLFPALLVYQCTKL